MNITVQILSRANGRRSIPMQAERGQLAQLLRDNVSGDDLQDFVLVLTEEIEGQQQWSAAPVYTIETFVKHFVEVQANG